MVPISLTITNFRSFKGTQLFRFPEQRGLYFMQGVNEVEPRLGANGSGKTTIWDALTWCYFGKTPRGLKAGDVCNWDAEKGTAVEFTYYNEQDPDCTWTMTRTWNPNTWTLSHLADYITDEEVIDLTKADSNAALADLALDFVPWLNSVLTAQRQPMFLDLDKTQQAALFSDVMALDRWLDFSAKASKRAAAQDLVSRGYERELSNLRGQLDQIGNQDFRESREQWDRKRKARADEIASEHGKLVDRSKELKHALEVAEDDETEARKDVVACQPDAGLVKDARSAAADVSDYDMMVGMEEDKLRVLNEQLEVLKRNGVCPTCRQTLSGTAQLTEITRTEKDIGKVRDTISRHEREMIAARGRRNELEGQLQRQESLLDAARDALDEAVRAVSGSRREYELNERELDRLEERAEDVLKETNPYAAMEDKAQRDGARLRGAIEDAQADLDESSHKHSLYSYWVRGFKELRLTQIAEALTELEVEVNSCVTALGLLDWELEFQVDRETKSGSVQRGFNVFVRSPHNARAVPWEAWSGGEGQRLRVAGTMGLADLIRSRTGTTLPLEVWDEPTQGLDPNGVRDLLEALAARALTEQRQIWIIDHTSHDFGGFAGGATITKTKDGSVISQY